MKTNLSQSKRGKDCCCFCGGWVNLNDEGVTFGNGDCAHEECNDSNEFSKANESDFRD